MEGKPPFRNFKDVLEADVVAVESVSRIDERIAQTVFGNSKVSLLLHSDMLVARIFGKRLATPDLFKTVCLRRVFSASTTLSKDSNWATNASFQCRPACTHPAAPKLALQVSEDFTKRHYDECKPLLLAAALAGSRWKLMKPTDTAGAAHKVRKCEHLRDLDDPADISTNILDPLRTKHPKP